VQDHQVRHFTTGLNSIIKLYSLRCDTTCNLCSVTSTLKERINSAVQEHKSNILQEHIRNS
jgi:hypothetical protein